MKINVDFIYPIGSIYISTESINPSVLFGGTWVQTCKSRALAGAGSNIANTNSSYGAYAAGTLNLQAGELLGEISHKLTVAEMPSHKHPIPYRTAGGGQGSTWYTDPGTADGSSDSKAVAVGGNGAHNNIMPIEVYYIWKRVS